jgi:hypothetical protein
LTANGGGVQAADVPSAYALQNGNGRRLGFDEFSLARSRRSYGFDTIPFIQQ